VIDVVHPGDDRPATGTTPTLPEPTAPTALFALGWDDARASAFVPHAEAGLRPGRVVSVGGRLDAQTAEGPVEVVVQRRFRRSTGAGGYPVVGDWLALEPVPGQPDRALLRTVLPRRSRVARADVMADRSDAPADVQVVAANVDVCLIVTAFGRDLNPRRLERYLLLAWSGGARPVIIVNKADQGGATREAALAAVLGVAGDAPVHVVSARTGEGVGAVEAIVGPGVTACLLGSSGVGKSTLTNVLLGVARQAVAEVRADDQRGRHTTTRRELVALPGGGLLVDTPGLRSVGVWDDGEGLAHAFADVDELAARCRFADCRHGREPGCAVRAAIEAGELPAARLADQQRLELEARAQERRSDVRVARAESRRLGRLYRDAAKATRWKGWRDG
jgi:ribosome biogenesis GTPase / thiamine phosphate phosphatase